MTTALEGGEWSASRPGRSLPPGKTRYPLYRRLGGPQGRSGQVRKISPPPGFDLRNFQPVASRYTDWATRPTPLPVGVTKSDSYKGTLLKTLPDFPTLVSQIFHSRNLNKIKLTKTVRCIFFRSLIHASHMLTRCFSCSPPDLNFLDHYLIFMYMHYNHCHRATAHLQFIIIIIIIIIIIPELQAAACFRGAFSCHRNK
jgi:hypothetical protein